MFAAMQKRFRKVICALKEHSSVKYAKVATFGGFCDLDLIIVKATSPDDFPLPERYINELLNIFSTCPSSFHSFSLSFTRRFGRTHSWKVALKCLLLLHRLLRSLPEHSPFRAELLSRSNGLLSLYPCHFRDHSSSNPEDYTIFIRSYAQLLDEALEYCFTFDRKDSENDNQGENEEVTESEEERLQEKMKQVNEMLEILPQLQSLMDRVMECRPTGAAARSFIVQSAMKYIIRDSFKCYTVFRKEIVLVLDNLIQMPYRSCISSFGIYKKAAKQADELCEFYEWCKVKGLCGCYEYPFIEKIPGIQIRALETFLNGMWQLTESSSSATSPSPSPAGSSNKSCSTEEEEEDDDKRLLVSRRRGFVVCSKWVKFEESGRDFEGIKEEMKPLIQFEEEEEEEEEKGDDDENDDWEVLLDTSVEVPPSSNLISNGDEGMEQCQIMQLYNPNPFNPFSNHYYNCY